jgi:hypothetical protein
MPAGARKGIFSGSIFALDGLPTPVAAYALHRLSRNYQGHLITVRRSSDNAIQSFGANQPEIDVSEIQSWVGSGNTGFVTEWFDQSGNNRQIAQTTTTLQPTLVESGSVVLLNIGGKSTINFSPNKELNLITNVNLGQAIVVFRSATTTFSNYHTLFGASSVESTLALQRFGSICQWFNTGIHNNPFPDALWRNSIARSLASSNTFSPITASQVVTISHNRPGRNRIFIGNYSGVNGGACLQPCAIAFSSPLSNSDRITLETRLMSYYGIT